MVVNAAELKLPSHLYSTLHCCSI